MRLRSFPIGLVLAPLAASTAAAQVEVLHAFAGDSAGDRLGTSAAMAGDVDGDGVPDVVVGAPNDDKGAGDGGSAIVFSGLDGSIVWEFHGDSTSDHAGSSVAGIGDVDGDGFGDVIVGAEGDDTNGTDSGSAYAVSGQHATVIWQATGETNGALFGFAVDGGGDFDGDSVPDVLVGAWEDDTGGPSAGAAYAISGATGIAIHSYYGLPGDMLGVDVNFVGDVDGDGRDDFVVGALQHQAGNGYARLISGLDGTDLHLFEGATFNSHYGESLGPAGDVDRDGVPDLLIGAPQSPTAMGGAIEGPGEAWVHSGADHSILHAWTGLADGDHFGVSVTGLGDADGDGYDDVAVGAFVSDIVALNAGSVWMFSGRTGGPIGAFHGSAMKDWLGIRIDGGYDVDADGFGDLVIGAEQADPNGAQSGAAYLVSPPLRLDAPTETISAADGGSQDFEIDAGAENGLNLYWLMGTLSGTQPGFPVDGVHLPLNPDPWLFTSLQLANGPIYVHSFDVLPASGQTTASFATPAGLDASFVGLVFHHAFLVLDLSQGGLATLASNAFPVTLVE